MLNIIPMKDLRDTNRISDLCHSKNEPIFVTKNGYGDLVVMSMELYESLISQAGYQFPVITKPAPCADRGSTAPLPADPDEEAMNDEGRTLKDNWAKGPTGKTGRIF